MDASNISRSCVQGGCEVTLLLSDSGITTVQSIVGGRSILPPARTVSADCDDENPDSAGPLPFRHPTSAQSELERDLCGTLLALDAPDYVLSRAVLGQIADTAIRAIYGPDADAAAAPVAHGHAAAALQATVRARRGHYSYEAQSVSVHVHIPGAKSPEQAPMNSVAGSGR